MAIVDDFTLNYSTKKISHTSGTTRYTVNELYSWLMDLFDDAGQMDDSIPIKANTPTEYELINNWEFNADSDVGYLSGGSIVVNKTGGNDVWANFYTLGTIEADGIVYWYQNGTLVSPHPTYTAGHIDQLIKVTAGGTDVDNRYITAFIRNDEDANSDLYDHFSVQATVTGGRNPVPIATSPDTNDDGTGDDVVGVTVTFGATTKDISDGMGAEPYDVVIDGGGNSMLSVYKYLKYITRRQNTAAVGTGNTTQGRFYIKAQSGYSEVKTAPFGTFAGGKFFGARGVWVENISDMNNRQLIDANGATHTPPNTIYVTVTSVTAGDRVLVARGTAGLITKDQFTVTGTTADTITVSQAIATDIPSTGVIRVGDVRYTFTGINRVTKTFTGVSPSAAGELGTAAYVPLIDEIATGNSINSQAMIYNADFDTIVRVRHKGILPFENSGTVGSTGLTISAIRTSDTIVQ